jgi:hypothetical protein
VTDTDLTRREIEQTRDLMKVLYQRLRPLDCILADNKESIAYRIAEIMAASKNLYTVMLPSLMEEADDERTWELIVEMRMHFLHQLDLIQEFEELFMESIVRDEEEAAEAEPEQE